MWEDIWRADSPPKDTMDAADRDYARWIGAQLSQQKLVGFLVEVAGKPEASGCVWLQPVQPNPRRIGATQPRQPYLLSMYTEPLARGRGHAVRIVRAAIQWAKRAGYGRMTLHAADMGVRIYERIGFERSREMRLDFGRRKVAHAAKPTAKARGAKNHPKPLRAHRKA